MASGTHQGSQQRVAPREPRTAASVFHLTFHGIGTPGRAVGAGERRVWLRQEKFLAILDGIVGRPEITVTFDDGNASDADIALPALIERELRATFFVVADRINRPGYASTGDLQRMIEAGMTVGSHGLSHRSWRRLGDTELASELVRSRDLISDAAGTSIEFAACPFGAYDRRVLRNLRALGFSRVYTSDGGRANPTSWLQPRTSLREHDDVTIIDAITASCRREDIVRGMKRRVKAWR